MNGLERFVGVMEIERTIRQEEPDEVDKLLCKNGVLYNDDLDLDYQENHE